MAKFEIEYETIETIRITRRLVIEATDKSEAIELYSEITELNDMIGPEVRDNSGDYDICLVDASELSNPTPKDLELEAYIVDTVERVKAAKRISEAHIEVGAWVWVERS